MQIKRGEIQLANSFITAHFDRIIDWAVGDIKRCCRMRKDGSCNDKGALVGAFVLWCCAIDYFGGLYTGFTSARTTKSRIINFIDKYMDKYDAEKVYDLRWSLIHFYSPHHYVLYHENSIKDNETLHLAEEKGRIMMHLGHAVKDFEEAVIKYHDELKKDNKLKVKAWRYYKEHLPIMPIKVEEIITPQTLSSLATGAAVQVFNASGTVSQKRWG